MVVDAAKAIALSPVHLYVLKVETSSTVRHPQLSHLQWQRIAVRERALHVRWITVTH